MNYNPPSIRLDQKTEGLEKESFKFNQITTDLKLFKKLINQLSDAIFVIDPETSRFLDVNDTACSNLGYSREELLNMSVVDIEAVIPNLSSWKEHVIEVQKKGYMIFEGEHKRKDGTRFPVEENVKIISQNDNDYMVAVVRDISQRKRAENALRESEAKYRSLFENSKDVVFICSKDGYIIDINSAALDLLGYTKKEELPTKLGFLCATPSNRIELLSRIQSQDFLKDYPVDLRRKDNTIVHTLITAVARKDKDGKIVGYGGIIRDVTELRRNEEELKRTLNNLRKALGATIHAMALTVETRDPYTAGHQRRVANLARAIAQEMGLPADQIDGIRMSAAIHDLGKISVPAELLSKPSRLTEIEFALIKTHPKVGYEILKTIEFPWPVAQIVLQHHERIDGSGYPQGLSDKDILLEAKILGVADVVEAMASHRPYRAALGIDKAIEEISKNKGILYEPDVVDACLKLFLKKGYVI